MGVLKPLIVFAGLLICAGAQKPFYASGGQYPPVLPQNQPNTPAGDLGTRFGQNSNPDPNVKNPVYHVEQELVDRVKEYPRDKQPYWYVNAAQLNSFKNQTQGAPASLPENQQAAQQRAGEREQVQQRFGNESSRLNQQRVQQASNRPQSVDSRLAQDQQYRLAQEQYRANLELHIQRQEEELRKSREQLRELQKHRTP